MKKYHYYLLITLLFFIILYYSDEVYASDVTIIINSENQEYSQEFQSDIDVIFENKLLYNENLFLSYHIVDRNGNELLFENQRIPITLENGIFSTIVDINLKNISNNVKNMIVQFDILDAENERWYSLDNVDLNTTNLFIDLNPTKAFLEKSKKTINQHIYIFYMNCLVSIVVLFLIFNSRKCFK